MKLTQQRPKPGDIVLNMASMIDVVFLVLIFFMCTTSFRPPEGRLRAPVEKSGIASAASPRDDFEPVRIRLAAAGDAVLLYVNDAAVSGFDALFSTLEHLRGLADVPVIIEADDGVKFKHCVKALDLCRKADFSKVAFRA